MLLRNLSACQYRKQGRTSWSFWQNPGATAKPPVNWRLGNLVRTPQNCYATVKLVALVAVPPGVVMAILPVSAPLGTIAVTRVSEFTVKVAFTPWKVTFVVCLRLTPVIVTAVPTAPLVGEKLVICGMTRNILLLFSFPPEVVTVTIPVVAPLGTVAVK